MKRLGMILMASLLLLGFTQCKKEEMPASNQPEGVRITLDVDGGNNGNSKVVVDPTGHTNPDYATVTFEEGDIIYVGNNGQYCGTLTYNGNKFEGTISGQISDEDYLHFYFLGGVGFNHTIDEPNNTATVNITDQTSKYPVISYAPSTKLYKSGVTSYTAKLQNYCSIVKFTTNNIPVETDITVKGMKNTVSVNFGANNAAAATPTLGVNPYTPGNSGTGDITLHAESTTERWAILLEQEAVTNAAVTAFGYFDGACDVPAIANNTYHSTDCVSISMTASIINLSEVTSDITIQDGYTVINTLAGNYKISIADGATVTLDGVNINGSGTWTSGNYAGITCLGDAHIILSGTNTVKGFDSDYPGIHVAMNSTLTISGSGALNASSNDWAAGIGGGYKLNCGNIVINGGDIEANGGYRAAGIGAGAGASCGNITITNGIVTGNGGNGGAGIGTGVSFISNNVDYNSICGVISISGGEVNATGGLGAAGIGTGFGFSKSGDGCNSISITGGTVTAVGGNGGTINDIMNGGGYNYDCPGGAGIGTGSVSPTNFNCGHNQCGTITIEAGASVTASKGSGTDTNNSIGKNTNSSNYGLYGLTCGTVTIGGTVYWDGSSYQNGGDTYLTVSPCTFPQ